MVIPIWLNTQELIDTLWNVNEEPEEPEEPKKKRINRYIMECKYSPNPYFITICGELIDTLWNVNSAAK